jgi:hypothetical protein
MNRPTSIYLDLVRFGAAAVVFVVHAGFDRFTGGLPILWRFGDLGNDAVMVFFVLSGFVIAYVSDQKETTPREYFAASLLRSDSCLGPYRGPRLHRASSASTPLRRLVVSGRPTGVAPSYESIVRQ